jgi:hypothetical protein
MEDLINSMDGLKISQQNPYHKIIPESVRKMIYTDIEYMFRQIVSEHIQSSLVTFELFKNMNQFKLEEIKIIHEYISKYSYAILEHCFKNSGLYYNPEDLKTYIDYYTDEISEIISLQDGC